MKHTSFVIVMDAGAGELDREEGSIPEGVEPEVVIRNALLKLVARVSPLIGDTFRVEHIPD